MLYFCALFFLHFGIHEACGDIRETRTSCCTFTCDVIASQRRIHKIVLEGAKEVRGCAPSAGAGGTTIAGGLEGFAVPQKVEY